jgi:hypothetical protein
MIISRGEAVRNFLYSDTLKALTKNAKVTLLSVVDDDKFIERYKHNVEKIVLLKQYKEHKLVILLRAIIAESHFLWLGSEVAKNHWETRLAKASTLGIKFKHFFTNRIFYALANRRLLESITALTQLITWKLRPNNDFVTLFKDLKPDLVFNCSHVHGPAAELPLVVAHKLNIPTAGFIFSWDNLTSCSRILAPYDYYLVWHKHMKEQLISMYPSIKQERVFSTGTPQFDFHFKSEFYLSREELCSQIGIDPKRPFVLYTTGIDRHFPKEHLTVESVIKFLQDADISPKPQLVVRTYAKGTSLEMKALAQKKIPAVVFPPVKWQEKWFTPMLEDVSVYTNLLRHCCLGINAASTVSLELLINDKPVVNLGFDPPKSNLLHHCRWIRHIHFDHYRLVAQSGAVMVAYSEKDMHEMLTQGLTRPQADSQKRKHFIETMFDNGLDGNSGLRVAEKLIQLASEG